MKTGVRLSRASLASRLLHWRQHHQTQARESLLRLLATPWSSTLTILVIALALALPALLLSLLADTRSVIEQESEHTSLSVYLPAQTDAATLRADVALITSLSGVAAVDTQTAAQSLEEFERLTQSSGTLSLLGQNPLPAVLTVYPLLHEQNALQALQAELQRHLPQAEIELDMAWLQRLATSLAIATRLFILLFGGMALAVLLVVTNTTRLAIEARRDEIVTLKLLGATHGMVRRPFLYAGFWTGLIGGVCSTLFVAVALVWLNQPVQKLAHLYHSSFSLHSPGLLFWCGLPAFAVFLGLLGAYMAMYRHLRELEPQ